MLRVWKSLNIDGKNINTIEETQVIKKSVPGVIITIAREHGSSGKQIGKLVFQKLCIPFYYKEMTALAAQESGLDKEFISDINSNAPTTLHSLYLSTEVIQQAVVAQDKVIRNIADNGISELAWGDRHNYEFMIDSSIGIEASVDIICHYIQSRKKIKQK